MTIMAKAVADLTLPTLRLALAGLVIAIALISMPLFRAAMGSGEAAFAAMEYIGSWIACRVRSAVRHQREQKKSQPYARNSIAAT